ncbi:MAG: proteasome accessory factor PafA2 family protein [Vulcanimicrobiota bacterium]
MLERLMGLETEYVIRYSSQDGSDFWRGAPRPTRQCFYEAIETAVKSLLRWAPAIEGIFLENGQALSFEHGGLDPDGGLLEAKTPECRTVAALLTSQKAQEAMLLTALGRAEARLPCGGKLGLVKNCRDALGNTYGAQENYEVEIASGRGLLAYRTLLGLVLVLTLLPYSLMTLCFGMGLLLWRILPAYQEVLWQGLEELCWRLFSAPGRLFARVLDRFAFRDYRSQATAFFISRQLFTGAGTLRDDGCFELSERAAAVSTEMTSMRRISEYSLFKTTHLHQQMLWLLGFRPVARLFWRRQRLQVGCSDANMAQTAEYLKIGTTSLVLDMVEAGLLHDAPRLEDPVWAYKAVSADPTLACQVATDRGRLSALALQGYYLDKARQFVADSPSLEAARLVTLWGETLDLLGQDPARLFGRIDWVTKRILLEESGSDCLEVKKKLDLKYHELGTGYLAALERAGYVPSLVPPEAVQEAMTSPPADTPAWSRGQLIRRLEAQPALFHWDWARVGGLWNAKVIQFRQRER